MIRNQFILVIVMVMSALGVAAQSLSVESFRALENDLTAINTRTERKDFNGETAALIKVVNPNTGFTFEGGAIGIVHTQQEVGEIWVYVPRGIKKITIKHSTLGVLRDYFFPCAIEAARTYELKLISGQVMTTVVQDIGGQYLSLSVTPANAMVYIDEQLRSLDSDGTLSLFLPRGRHTYRVEAASHMADAGAFEISTKKEKFSVVLKSALATLTVSVDDPMASIYVNDQSRGTGSWTGSLEAGMYVVEARRSGYRTVRQSVALSTQEQKTISLTGLVPIYGMLQLSSTPIEASVYIDGKLVGTSPDIFRNIFAGVRELKITKSGYKDIVKQVTIEENKLCQEQVTLEKGVDKQFVTSDVGGNQTFTVKGVSFNMIAIAGGTFTMGATAEQGSDAGSDEKPAHQVTLSDYSIGATEVTQQLWEAVMGSNPSYDKSPTNPVEKVSWNDCQEFIKKLNSLTGAKFALPTEAQWEYAARGGSKSQGYKYSGSNNPSDVAWHSGNSGSKTHPVSTKSPNELGLYDMSGNVWEWCNDWYGSYSDSQQRDPTGATSGSYRIIRGGSWCNSQRYCRVSYRLISTPGGSNRLGLRLALICQEQVTLEKGADKQFITSDVGGNQTFTVKGVSFNMIAIAGGTFTMGATAEQGSDAEDREKPAHQVTLSDYSIGETEVTQQLWEAVMGSNPSYDKSPTNPVECVSWDDCQEFIKKLNSLTGAKFALPTEAQWEYAARGGSKSQGYKYSGSNNLSDVAWYIDNSGLEIHPVSTKSPNELGLYDMSGNVSEWCNDLYGSYSNSQQRDPTGATSGSFRVNRGGSWYDSQGDCRVSGRSYYTPGSSYCGLGLRLALICQEQVTLEKGADKQFVTSDVGSNQTFTVKGVSFNMIAIAGGTFTMGATAEQGSDAGSDEKPAHQVTLSDYSIGATEVTQQLWEAVMGSNPSYDKSPTNPVECVSWDDCQEFIKKLNSLTGAKFALPTEAQWEYAARGGSKSQGYKYSGSNNLSDVAWYKDNSGSKTHPVSTKSPNELGLYDMSGNVWEWCNDWYGSYSDSQQRDPTGATSGSGRVLRDGGWGISQRYCRVSFRNFLTPSYSGYDLGLRLALVQP